MVFGELGKRRLKGLGELALHWLAGGVIIAVVGHAVDEK